MPSGKNPTTDVDLENGVDILKKSPHTKATWAEPFSFGFSERASLHINRG